MHHRVKQGELNITACLQVKFCVSLFLTYAVIAHSHTWGNHRKDGVSTTRDVSSSASLYLTTFYLRIRWSGRKTGRESLRRDKQPWKKKTKKQRLRVKLRAEWGLSWKSERKLGPWQQFSAWAQCGSSHSMALHIVWQLCWSPNPSPSTPLLLLTEPCFDKKKCPTKKCLYPLLQVRMVKVPLALADVTVWEFTDSSQKETASLSIRTH